MSKPRKTRTPDEEVQFSVRVNGAEMVLFQQAADAVGVSLASWTRTQLRRSVGLPTA